MQMKKEKPSKVLFEIWCYDKYGEVVERRKFYEARVLDFYVRWCTSKEIVYVFVKDISMPFDIALAKYERVKPHVWVYL